MSDEQINAFRAGSLTDPQAVNLLMLSLFCATLLLWSSWALISAYRGVASHRLSWRELGGMAARTLLLLLVSFLLVLS
ncbi:integrating conjugative element protein (TIGR03758 family) [Erwinia toletana]|uniref:Integrating conjugative element protein (TIGR03758 family) n=1 Tax=Winslowiella toletana TaxID=92490 RepID=A0ABS4PDK5_9GAMM|nr:TIGR03758 family integrating conjugative element protein [Winslowiella toletana]MBP2170719.1 integrating conjugative element protein (TIGR03758 family) [Winslowiella toletana]